MKKTGKPFLNLAIVCCFLVLAGMVFVDLFVRPPGRANVSEMSEDLKRFFGGVRVLKDSVRISEDLSRIKPGAHDSIIEQFRSRARYQKQISSDLRIAQAGSNPCLRSLAKLPGLLMQGEELLDMTLDGSPPRSVPTTQAAIAPALSQDAKVTGVLPGVRKIVAARAVQLNKDARTLVEEADNQAFSGSLFTGRFLGVSLRRWMLLPCIPALAALLSIVIALRYLKKAPGRLVEEKIRRAARNDPRKGVGLCHEQVASMLDLAEKMMGRSDSRR